MKQIFHHPFSLIIASPSNGGKSTLAYNIIKNSAELVSNTDNGFDSVWVLYKSKQPLYETMKQELKVPLFFFEKTFPEPFESLLSQVQSKAPVVIIDDGLCKENYEVVEDLFCRLGHHCNVSIILITQTLFDTKNPTLRICHRNCKNLIIFRSPRDLGSLRILISQVEPDKRKRGLLLQALEKEFEIPYSYVMFDFHPLCPPNERYKTNLLCEKEPYPIALSYNPAMIKSDI